MKPEDLRSQLRDIADELNLFAGRESQPKKPRAAALPQVRGRSIDGNYYVRADDIADLLDERGLAPGLVATLRKKASA